MPTQPKTAPSVGGLVVPQNFKDEVDFAYVADLAEPERRLAAYYEYARHSDEIKELVVDLRREGVFKEGHTGDIDPQLQQRVFRNTGVVRMEFLLRLVEHNEFPDKPFKAAMQNPGRSRSVDQGFGINKPCWMPWKAFFALLRDGLRRGLKQEELIDAWNEDSSTINAISIPWNYTDDELVDFFRELIPSMRPKNRAEPRKAGRRGRSSGFGATTMLNQLAAYRLREAGYDFESAGRFKLYSSLRGWKNAIRIAEERIGNMTRRPFFV